ncbi:hypothetical protein KC207_13820 [Phycicoccus sp. BSK3Z-2]|uniref:PD-(D/E)XK nuclease-like domain-containing protein n=1 Tax=Phycicoccus avicenniae TaxID=2828860 RepID=A0A941I0Q7_9MICO|nr:hypothetical protein [Phycicoccus avicenniae]MBR7744367.1 hypothetical protein [Phycicoccus avicenniae]
MVSGDLLRQHQAYYRGDRSEWQQQVRLLQSLWRQSRGLPPGGEESYHGSYLPETDEIRDSGAAYISDDAVAAARRAVEDKQRGAVMQPKRLWSNLLSSQPLCFNLFGPLSQHLDDPRTSTALARVWPDIGRVAAIRYEWSPGRKDPRFLNNGTAFDVYVEYDAVDGSQRFLGIEVKYREDLAVKPPTVGDRPRQVFEDSGAFASGSFDTMSTGRNAQILLDHLLALSMTLASETTRTGRFVLLYPARNSAVTDVIASYAPSVIDDTFVATTLETVVDALRAEVDEPWVDELHRRYLDTSVIDPLDAGR